MKLSIVILNYNTKELTLKCIESVIRNKPDFSYEIIVIDNGSEEMLSLRSSMTVKLIRNKKNLGFAGGNNTARKIVKGEYVLFLNSDTEVHKNTLSETVKYLDKHSEVGALTCKIILLNGKLDRDARRSFPTPFVALTHFSGLDKFFPKSKVFSRYWYGYKNPDEIHEVDVLQGAYFLTRKKLLDDVDWFSEDYFLDGEDIDLSWKIKSTGAKIIYYPKVTIVHIKKASKRRGRNFRAVLAGVNSMEIFYKKYLWERYPLFINLLVVGAIYIMKLIRIIRVIILGW